MTNSKLFEEIRKLQQRGDELVGEHQRLRETNETLDEANLAIHEELARANRAMKKEGIEKSQLHDDIRRLNEELLSQNEEIENLHRQLAKAQRTIKVQSDQIASPNEKKVWQTPTRVTPPSRPVVGSSQVPPRLLVPQRRPTRAYPQEQRPLLPAFEFPKPRRSISPTHQDQQQDPHQEYQHAAMPTKQSSNALPLNEGEPGPTIENSSRDVMRLPDRLSGGKEVDKFFTPTGTVVGIRREEGEISLLVDLSPLFFLGETWARRYCTVPSKSGDAAIPFALKDRIASLTNPNEVQTLLSHGFSRPLIIAKIINYEITTTCLRPSVINGFRPSVDQRLGVIRNQNSATLAINVRRGILVAAAEIIQEAVTDPRFESWVERQANQNAATTWYAIGPLCVANTDEVAAQAGLIAIWLEAYRVGVKMACKPSIFTTDFPPTGPQSVFNPANMVNKDYGYGMSGTELAKRGSTVRLAVTPVVMEMDFSGRDGNDRLEPRCLHFSNCLLTYH